MTDNEPPFIDWASALVDEASANVDMSKAGGEEIEFLVVEALRKAYRAGSTWRSMAEAPRDGTPMNVWLGDADEDIPPDGWGHAADGLGATHVLATDAERTGGMKTHIRRRPSPRVGLGQIYCKATPTETISFRHYTGSLIDGSPQQGHVASLPAPLCAQCVKQATRYA